MRHAILAIFLFVSAVVLAQTKRGDVLVEFSLKEEAYYAEVFRKEWREPRILKLCSKDALDIAYDGPSLYKTKKVNRLYTSIIKPLEGCIKKGDRVFFVPAGNIYFINLAALSNESGTVLGDLYHFHRLSSLNGYSQKEDKPSFMHWILFGGIDYLADPERMFSSVRMLHLHNNEHLYKDIIPQSTTTDDFSFGVAEDGTRAGYKNLQHSRSEIKDLWTLRSFGMRFYTGFKACEEEFRFITRSQDPYIVLLSTHSFTISGRPNDLACGLLFSGAGHTLEGRRLPHNLNDGILYAQEIETMNLEAASMVVLAACNTGLGIVTQNGVRGLQSAFKKAGAKTLVMTLWSVNDRATAAFTKSLFTHLNNKKTKQEAFELAIKDLRQSNEFHDPAYWAPFIMLD